MYVCVYLYLYLSVSIYMYAYTYMYISICICLYLYLYAERKRAFGRTRLVYLPRHLGLRILLSCILTYPEIFHSNLCI